MSAGVSRAGGVSDADIAAFEAVRPRLLGIARRVLGSAAEAEDVVQDAWIRWQRADRAAVRDAPAFLATITMRLAITVAASARARRETPIDPRLAEPVDARADPAARAERRDAVRRGLRILLERLTPAERAAYVLREAFDERYRQISVVLAVSEVNARPLAARARARVTGAPRAEPGAAELQRLLEGFLAASHGGDLAALERLLVPNVPAA